MVEPCDRTSFDLSGETQAIASVRSRYPAVTDALSAVAISLLPPGIIDMAGAVPNNDWTFPRRRLVEVASLIRGELNLQPKADVSPADFAQSIMFALTYEIMRRSAVANVSSNRDYASTVAADTYIKLISARPELGRGPHVDVPTWQDAVTERLQRGDAYTYASSKPTAPVQLYQGVPAFLSTLTAYFGAEFYHPDETTPGQYVTHYPMAAADAAALWKTISACGW
jgi:hypothetical protein